ncbi:hypothetical protein LTR62_004732 [Meristemomyces frigidus]|uniref:Uncharacterized protein n=1 Tax=Meristemomyces frigidus TaxID=1508187 RepID=A0AAN7YR93_9PEZI|nr:hypothetical protein LTR62_004732 [Meristemomyces frigidus]
MLATNAESKKPATTSRPPAKLNKADEADVDAINASLDRMRKVTSSDPYVLTIPQDIEPRYHHAHQFQAFQWTHNTPFDYKEGEKTQYQTFVYHEHGKDMYVLHNSMPREEREVKPKGTPVNGAGTPNTGGPKKKISLNAYKKSKTGAGTPAQSGTPSANVAQAVEKKTHAAVKGPAERVKAETEEVLTAVAEFATESKRQPVAANKELKRKRDNDSDEEQDQHETEKLKQHDATARSESVAKKARQKSPTPSSPPRNAISPVKSESNEAKRPAQPSARANIKALPPKLSPPNIVAEKSQDLPAKLSPLHVPDLPARLSPTIPANIAATLRAHEHTKSSTLSNAPPSRSSSRNGKLTPPSHTEAATKRKSPVPRNAFRANSSSPAVRTDDVGRAKIGATAATRFMTPGLRQDNEETVDKAVKTQPSSSKLSLMVKLKYKKQQSEGIRRILKMRPNPAKMNAASQPSSTVVASTKDVNKLAERRAMAGRDPGAKGVAQRVGPAPKGVAQKVGPPAKSLPEVKRDKGEKRVPAKANADVSPNARDDDQSKPRPDEDKPTTVRKFEPRSGKDAPASSAKGHETDEAVSRLRTGRASLAESTSGSKAPEFARYEPPARRKDSATKPELEKTLLTNATPSTDLTASAIARQAKRKEPSTVSDEIKNEEPEAKRKKISEGIETAKGLSTPHQTEGKSPSLLKSQQATPSIRKDLLSAAAMVREKSSEAGNVNTPGSSSAKSSTPVPANGPSSQPNPARAPPSSQLTKTQKQLGWEAEQKRLEILGREIKHAATAHLNKVKPAAFTSSVDSEARLAAVKSLESLLAYILAFASADEAALSADPKQSPAISRTWQSLHGFFAFVRRTCEAEPLLVGLASHLGVVYAGHILRLVISHGKSLSEKDMSEVTGILVREAKAAEELLGLDTLMDVFPGCWRGRLKSALPRDQNPSPRNFSGPYKLPVGVHTVPVVAARAGYAMLVEWIAKHGIDYSLKLKLGHKLTTDNKQTT